MKKKSKPLGKRRQEYNRELKRIKSTLTRYANKGYTVKSIETLLDNVKPLTISDKAPTASEVKKIKAMDLMRLKNTAIFRIDLDTGEAVPQLQVELQEIRRKEREQTEIKAILRNAQLQVKQVSSDEEYAHFKKELQTVIKQRGKRETAIILQNMPNVHQKKLYLQKYIVGNSMPNDYEIVGKKAVLKGVENLAK